MLLTHLSLSQKKMLPLAHVDIQSKYGHLHMQLQKIANELKMRE